MIDSLNTTMVRSSNKSPFEVVFGQRPNITELVKSWPDKIQLDVVDDLFEKEHDEAATDINFEEAARKYK